MRKRRSPKPRGGRCVGRRRSGVAPGRRRLGCGVSGAAPASPLRETGGRGKVPSAGHCAGAVLGTFTPALRRAGRGTDRGGGGLLGAAAVESEPTSGLLTVEIKSRCVRRSASDQHSNSLICLVFRGDIPLPELLRLGHLSVAAHAPQGHARSTAEDFLELLVRE